MFKKILVYSRQQIESGCLLNINRPYAIISICGTREKKARIPQDLENCKGILFLHFDDINKRYDMPEQGMSAEDSIKILDFVKKYENQVEYVVVNCMAGISRSRGVAAALCVIYNLPDNEHYTYGQPNSYVKSLILQTFRTLNV
jgi:predicted protein tyrosine phosphatase